MTVSVISLSRVCPQQLVTALYSKLSIETLVGEGKDVMIEICAMLQISSADCQKAVDEAVERVRSLSLSHVHF